MRFNDNVRLRFGTSEDSNIRFNGTDMIFNASNGELRFQKGGTTCFRTDANNDLFVTDRLDCEKLEVRGGKIKSDSGDNEFEFYPEGRSENDHPIFQIFNRTSPGNRPAIEQLGKGYVEFEGVWENTTSGGSDVRVTESGKLRRQVSSRKWKTNITDLTDFDCDLFLEKARPISYNPIQGNLYSLEPADAEFIGFIFEEFG